MLSRMSYEQLLNWMTYQRLYGPVNPLIRNDVGFAGVQLRIAQSNAKKGKTFKLDDFYPFPLEPKKEQTPQDHIRIFEQIVAAAGGQDLRASND